MSGMRFGPAALICLLLCCLAAPAVAQTAPEAARAQADALIRAGVALRKEGKEGEALDRFRQAYELDPSPRALGQMGLAAKSLRSWVEAERYLEGALAASQDAWVAENSAALELALEIVRKNLASLRVETNAPNAKLYVEGRQVASLPLDRALRVPAGTLRIEVHAQGHRSEARAAQLAAGQETALRFDLTPEPPASPPPPVAPTRPAPAPAPVADAAPSGDSQRTIALVVGGVGVVGIGVGAYFGLRTLSLKDQRDDACPEDSCPTDEGVELDEQARTAALWSNIGFGVGAAALAGAAVLWFTAPGGSDPTVSAGIGPGSAKIRIRF